MYPRKITFRLNASEAKQLYMEAKDSKASVHQTARDYVVERLTLADMERHLQNMAGELQEVRLAHTEALGQLSGLREGLTAALAILLAGESENISPEDARAWINDQMKLPLR